MSTETRTITRSVKLPASPERVFESLIRPREISQWWQASSAIVLARPGGVWTATWGDIDAPDYIVSARIAEFIPGKRLVMDQFQYQSPDGPLPFEACFVTQWNLSASESGCVLTVSQSGFPADPVADDYFQGCETGWDNTLAGISKLHGGEMDS